MLQYKIGITEAGDAGIDLSWEEKLSEVDGAILITKNLNQEFIAAAIQSRDKVIIHVTVTGFGGTALEPNVPRPRQVYLSLLDLLECGFPKEKIVIRIDPIIPTAKGLQKASWIIQGFMDAGFSRYRVSVLDLYPHVRQRFKDSGIPDPYNGSFQADITQFTNTDMMLAQSKHYWESLGNQLPDLRIEACAEPNLHEPIKTGCISKYDLQLLGLMDADNSFPGYQRKNCLCYSGKTELLLNKKQCQHRCLYCYWR